MNLEVNDVYDKLKKYLSEGCKELLDNKGYSTRVESLSKEGDIVECEMRVLALKIEVNSQEEFDKQFERNLQLMAALLSRLHDLNLLKYGRFDIYRMDLVPIEERLFRRVILAYVYFRKEVTNELINDILGVQIAVKEGELPKQAL